MGLRRYIAGRIVKAIPLVIIMVCINFVIMRLAPGDPAILLAGPDAPPEIVEEVRVELGLDKPIPEQLLLYLARAFRLDFGYSYTFHRPVFDLIVARLSITLQLVGLAIVFSISLGTLLGILAARKPYSLLDNSISISSLVLYSMPSFWIGLTLLIAFSLYIPIFPAGGINTIGVRGLLNVIADRIWHLILPVTVLGLRGLAVYARLTRASMLEVLRQDYIVTAWSKGLNEKTVLFGHALRNALLPLVTVGALEIRSFFSGAVLTEIVFGWPGLGRLAYEAILLRDYNLLMSIFLVISIVTVLVNLLADILYGLVDPRIRYSSRK
jgi:peptide/nickel transport system permease protein